MSRFIKFGDNILNLDNVVGFAFFDGVFKDPVEYSIHAVTIANDHQSSYQELFIESFKTESDRERRFKDLKNLLLYDQLSITVSQAIDAGVDLINKRVTVEGVIRGLDIGTHQAMVMIGVRQGWIDGFEKITVLD